jgi:hypothetical protein
VNLATVDCQITIEYLAIHGRQITSNDLAINEAKLLAIKMTLVNVILARDGTHKKLL